MNSMLHLPPPEDPKTKWVLGGLFIAVVLLVWLIGSIISNIG